MSSLHDLQARFASAVLDGNDDALHGVLGDTPEAARRGLAAYRRNVRGNLIAALEATYPVVRSIVGDEFLRGAAREYMTAYPSRSGDLNDYGGEFADFLATWPHAGDLPYLPDTARLEWLVQSVYYAADPPLPDLTALTDCDPAAWGDLRFRFHTGWARLDSAWPLDAIWRVNQPDYDGDFGIDFDCGARVLVLRRQGRVAVLALSDGEAGLIDALAAGTTLSMAHQAAETAAGDFDLTAALQRVFELGLISRALAPEVAP